MTIDWNCYWTNKGKYQADYDRLRSLLVPESGEAETEQGEALRYASNIYYDIYNNGGWNRVNERDELGRLFVSLEYNKDKATALVDAIEVLCNEPDDEDFKLNADILERAVDWLLKKLSKQYPATVTI